MQINVLKRTYFRSECHIKGLSLEEMRDAEKMLTGTAGALGPILREQIQPGLEMSSDTVEYDLNNDMSCLIHS